jgi:hypothetical protein
MPHQDIRRGITPLSGLRKKSSPPFSLPTPPPVVEEVIPVIETLETLPLPSPPFEPIKRRRMKKSA